MDSWREKNLQLEQLMPLIEAQLSEGKSVRYAPRGISMLPMIRQGIDSVVLSPVPDRLKKYDIPLYRRKSGSYVLHRVVSVEECYTCIGDNQYVYETGVSHEQIIAVVTAFYRGDKRYPVSDFGYRLYCGLWHGTRSLRRFLLRGLRWIKRRVCRRSE